MRNYEAEEQISNLGLSERLDNLVGKPTLDVGCGEHGFLVRHLRHIGIDSQGIDFKVSSEENYFIKKKVNSVGEVKGIPSRDNSYDLVTIHQNTYLNSVYGALRNTKFSDYFYGQLSAKRSHLFKKANEYRASAIILESLRVLKPGKELIIYPAPLHLESVDFLSDHNISREIVLNPDKNLFYIWHDPDSCGGYNGGITEDVSEFAKYRTVIKKNEK